MLTYVRISGGTFSWAKAPPKDDKAQAPKTSKYRYYYMGVLILGYICVLITGTRLKSTSLTLNLLYVSSY